MGPNSSKVLDTPSPSIPLSVNKCFFLSRSIGVVIASISLQYVLDHRHSSGDRRTVLQSNTTADLVLQYQHLYGIP